MAKPPMKMTTVAPPWACEPTDDRCVDPPFRPPFMTGISVRHSPSCKGEICGAVFGCDGGNWRVTGQGTLDRSEFLKGWIMTQLLTRGFVDCREHPLGKNDGGWWADSYRGSGPGNNSGGQFRSGSKLWALAYTHGGATNELLVRAMDYAYEAIAPLQRWGILAPRGLLINATWIHRGAAVPGAVMHLHIWIAGPGVAAAFTIEGQQMPSSDWLWDEYRPKVPSRAIGRLHGNVRPAPR